MIPASRFRIFGVAVSTLDLVLAFALVVILSACAPVANFAAGSVNEGLGDEAVLYLLPVGSAMPEECAALLDAEGVCFVPSYEAEGVRLRLRGDGLAIEARPECSGDASALVCDFGTIADPVAVEITDGGRVAASATYRRPGSNVVRQEIAVPYFGD